MSDLSKSEETFRACWWNGGGAIRNRISVNPGLDSLLKTNPDIFVYGEAACSNARGLLLSGYRFLFHRSYIKDEKIQKRIGDFVQNKYHNLISKAYSSKIFDIFWIKLATKSKHLHFCFLMLRGHTAPRMSEFVFIRPCQKAVRSLQKKAITIF